MREQRRFAEGLSRRPRHPRAQQRRCPRRMRRDETVGCCPAARSRCSPVAHARLRTSRIRQSCSQHLESKNVWADGTSAPDPRIEQSTQGFADRGVVVHNGNRATARRRWTGESELERRAWGRHWARPERPRDDPIDRLIASPCHAGMLGGVDASNILSGRGSGRARSRTATSPPTSPGPWCDDYPRRSCTPSRSTAFMMRFAQL